MDDDRIPVESGAEVTLVPHEHSESAQAELHKRTERIIEDSELPEVQCDHLVLKDVAATGGLKVVSMYVRTFGYGMSTVVEMKGAMDTFAAVRAVNVEQPWTL